ncbi:hypothetical protein AX16_008413 [Volvariella volvacea WC 439]|nr:hypothetical protein AX16_008413 [Volvariella volvacea WC 439]
MSQDSYPWTDLLPPELLIEIFVLCTYNEALIPLTLRSVCRRWRDIVDTSPRIWQHISLNDDIRLLVSSQKQAELWIDKSKPLPFDVELQVTSSDKILSLLAPLIPSISRWRNFNLVGERSEASTLLSTSEDPVQPCTDLAVNVVDDDWDELDTEGRATFSRQSPTSSRYTMNIWVRELPSPDSLIPLGFTNLTVTEYMVTGQYTLAYDVLNFLSACPRLETFYFWGWTHDNVSTCPTLPVVRLPYLHTLTLRSTCMTRALLSHIDAPNLSQLYLGLLNVEFALPGLYQEEGDSADEAQDPSQSPSSDHATGMGLRTLIHRSHPPIRVLEMDFSDMRTKDFNYMFNRLNTLEEFLIVASDMSDKVINLFRPYAVSGEESLQVRLPHLKRLSLYNCQRLSGAAIVDALGTRVEFTDHYMEATLGHVAIVDCERFTSHHAQMLSKTLGHRLHLH